MSNRNAAVDEFMLTLDHPQKAKIEQIRTLLLVDERVTEKIKWKAPTFGHEGNDQVTFHLGAKEGLQLILHRGVKVKDATGFIFEDPDNLLKWPAKDRAVLTIRNGQPLDPAIALLHRWMTETA